MIKIIFLTAFALVAFAFNSILCRLALRGGEADAAGFTLVRLIAGAAALFIISYFIAGRTKNASRNPFSFGGNWISAFFLFAYAICFSFAYLGLTAGTGAFILFGSVQLSMFGIALVQGERPRLPEWVGLFVAAAGLVYLVLPGVASPPMFHAVLMAAAGTAWGFYTLRGKESADPLADTTGNFVRSVPFVIAACIPFLPQLSLSQRGVVLAVLSGAVTSGIGYSVWYAALKYHSATRAAVLQLSVPIIAAAGGVLFLSEPAGLRLGVSSMLVLGGILLSIIVRGRKS